MGGSSSSNCTSTTAPMTATIRPCDVPAFGLTAALLLAKFNKTYL